MQLFSAPTVTCNWRIFCSISYDDMITLYTDNDNKGSCCSDKETRLLWDIILMTCLLWTMAMVMVTIAFYSDDYKWVPSAVIIVIGLLRPMIMITSVPDVVIMASWLSGHNDNNDTCPVIIIMTCLIYVVTMMTSVAIVMVTMAFVLLTLMTWWSLSSHYR